MKKSNALTYIVYTFEIHGKKYGIKNSIASAINVVATLHANNHINVVCLLTKLIIL
jgi:hypothetical protein